MAETKTAAPSDTTLAELVASALEAMGAGIGSLIDKPVVLSPAGRPFELGGDRRPAPTSMALSGQLEKDCSGNVHVLLGLDVAITMASYMMMVPDEAIRSAREAMNFTDDDEESLGEVGNVLFSALDEVLRTRVTAKVEIRLKEVSKVEAPSDLAGGQRYLVQPMSCTVGEFPAAETWLLLPWEACEILGRGPVLLDEGAPVIPADTGVGTTWEDDEDGDDRLEDIPEAELRGSLAAYVRNPALLRKLKKSCRRLGLTLEKRHKGEVPNPSALREHVVLLEIDRGEPRRFEWCRRLEAAGIQVVIVLLKPTRHQVALAFQSGTGRICGWPISEHELAGKLRVLLDGEETPDGEAGSGAD